MAAAVAFFITPSRPYRDVQICSNISCHFYFLEGHLLAHPETQAPKMRAENEGQTSIHISKSPPGHLPFAEAEF